MMPRDIWMFQSKPHRMLQSSNRMYIHGEHRTVTNLHDIAITSCPYRSLLEPFPHVVWCGHGMALLPASTLLSTLRTDTPHEPTAQNLAATNVQAVTNQGQRRFQRLTHQIRGLHGAYVWVWAWAYYGSIAKKQTQTPFTISHLFIDCTRPDPIFFCTKEVST